MLLTDWAFSAIARSALEVKVHVLLSPCITYIPATKATLFMNSLGNDRSPGGKRLTDFTEHIIPSTGNVVISVFKSNQIRKPIPETPEHFKRVIFKILFF